MVKNGPVPKSAQTLKFTQNLSFGAENDSEDFLWSGVDINLDVDAKGNIYVVDPGENRIMVYNAKGEFVKKMGGKGAGPGEFSSLRSFQVLKDGSAVAYENIQMWYSISHYDANIKYKDRIAENNADMILSTALYSPDGKYVAGEVNKVLPVKKQIENTWTVLDKNLKPVLKTYGFTDAVFDGTRATSSDYWAESLAQTLKTQTQGKKGYLAWDKNNNLYSAAGEKYEITKWSPDLKTVMVITREFKAIPIPEGERMAIAKSLREEIVANLPPPLRQLITDKVLDKAVSNAEMVRKAPIHGLVPMEDGKLIVIHNTNAITKEQLGDIFSAEGQFLGSFKMPNMGLKRMIFKNGSAYTVTTNEKEEVSVKRFSYKLAPQ